MPASLPDAHGRCNNRFRTVLDGGSETGDEMRFVEALGTTLAVTDHGSGPPVVFVHGMGLDHRMWEAQLGPISESGRRAISYDLRGHGASGVPATGYRVVDFAAEAIALIDALGLEEVDLVGLSLGGSVVARIAVRSPERVRSVAIIGSMASGYPRLSQFIRGGGTSTLVIDEHMDLEAFRHARLQSFLYAPTIADPVAGPLARRILLEALQTTAVLTETTLERSAGWPSPTDWELWIAPERRVPALVMAGSLDEPTFQGFAHDSAGHPRTRSRLVEGAAHLANMSHPAVVNQWLLEHLDTASG
jgi:pimeloyl-ACP methyl ester carboxylesterase